MTNRLFALALSILLSLSADAQDKTAKKYARTITTEELREHLLIIAADSMEGRETGERGQKMAAQYISGQLEESGLVAPVKLKEGSSYYQPFSLKKHSYHTAYLRKGDQNFENETRMQNLIDFLYYSKSETMGEAVIDVVFVGKIDDLFITSLDLNGKYVAFTNDEIGRWGERITSLVKGKPAGYIMLVESENLLQFAMDRVGKQLTDSKLGFDVEDGGIKTIIGGPKLAEWIFDQPFDTLRRKGKGARTQLIFRADYHTRTVESQNVLGFLEGTEKPDEILVITAHYDHEGIIDGEIYNGADDDGSGTVAVLELAEAFAEAARNGDGPKRSILFMTVSGEEKGLLGSSYYTDEDPVFPLEKTVANLNIDMIGRVDDKHAGNPDYIYLIGSDKLSQDLHTLSEKVNKAYTKLEFDYTYNADNDPNRFYYRSDHYNFAKHNIPVIFYFNGTHEDYHQPTDTVEKIDFEKIKKITDLIFYTAWEIANREERIQLDK